jgi:hypothetical protein
MIYHDEYTAYRFTADGRRISLVPLTFGRLRICIGPRDGWTYDDGW